MMYFVWSCLVDPAGGGEAGGSGVAAVEVGDSGRGESGQGGKEE